MTLIPALACLPATAAMATSHDWPADLAISCNPNGAVVVLGPATTEPGATYYLGKDCDAARKGGGTGQWWYAASGFAVRIGDSALRFGGDLDCPTLPYCTP